MGNEGSNLVSPETATNHKKRNRQTKTNDQYGIINPAEYLFKEQRKNRGGHREQTREGDWEEPTWRKESSHNCDYEAGR